jgi:hypothetical protein
MLTEEKIAGIIHLAHQDAEKRSSDAGYAGEWGDRGAGDIRDAVRIWRDGLNRNIPKELVKYARQAERAADKDYKTYLELKRRFEAEGDKE